MARRVSRETRGLKEYKARRACKDPWGHQECQERVLLGELKACRDYRDHKDPPATQELREHRGAPELEDVRGYRALMVSKASRGTREHQARKGSEATRAHQD